MIREHTRRQILGTLAVGVGSVSGCMQNPRGRFLSIKRVDVSNRGSDSGFEYELVVSHGYSAGPEEWGIFRNVELIGFNDNGTILCRKDIGTLSTRNDEFTVTLHCSEHPDYFSFLTDESPCEDDTRIRVVEWDSEEQSGNTRAQRCEDDLMSRVDEWEG